VRTNNQEITAVGLQPSTQFQTLLPGAGADKQQLLVVPCPAIDGNSTLAAHAQSFHEAALTSSAQSDSPFQAVVASDVETAQAGVASSVLGLALLVHSNDSGKVAELVFKAGSRSQEDAHLTACHFQVRQTVRLHHTAQACPGAAHQCAFLQAHENPCTFTGMLHSACMTAWLVGFYVHAVSVWTSTYAAARTTAGLPV
jgi:hypothetical protein